ncbi:carboxylesterase family protein [Streptomyces sp. NPDC050264]|uniref:carboxylesterase/lipase family protein n=1 Tax=Streptomyces sp. NPDC050264 TaxID=3155038 RepID=UPI00344902B3
MTKVRTGNGVVRGCPTEGVVAFRGIPYAAAPTGADRFGPPRPAAAWDGELDATRFGPTSPQPGTDLPGGLDLKAVVGPGWIEGEQSLTANVWTPDPAAGGLPVMVFVHGGAFVGGAGCSAGYDGTRFAQDGVVLVTFNYRVGVAGYASLAGAPENRGLRDQIAALHWVRENIAAFGGDPGKVTVFGESAGGMSVAALLAAAPEGLMRRAVCQSGAGLGSLTGGQAGIVSRALGELAGVAPDAASFAGLSDRDLVGAVLRLAAERPRLRVEGARDPLMGLSSFSTVIDGELLRGQASDLVAAGAAAGVDLLVGANAHEMNLYAVALGGGAAVDEGALAAAAGAVHPDPGSLIAAYRSAGRGTSPAELLSAIGTDHVFGEPARRLAEAHAPHPGGTWRYEFDWSSPAFDGRLGACHGLELPFVFDGVGRVDYGSLGVPDDESTRELARRTHRAWTAFATDGDPGWPRHTPERPLVQRIGADWATTEHADGPERALWHGVR